MGPRASQELVATKRSRNGGEPVPRGILASHAKDSEAWFERRARDADKEERAGKAFGNSAVAIGIRKRKSKSKK